MGRLPHFPMTEIDNWLDAQGMVYELGAYEGIPSEIRSVDFYNMDVEWWMETSVGAFDPQQ